MSGKIRLQRNMIHDRTPKRKTPTEREEPPTTSVGSVRLPVPDQFPESGNAALEGKANLHACQAV